MLALLAAPLARADDDQQEVMRDVGAVLGWRLGPATVEERCRAADPDGVAVRRQSLQAWLERNDALIGQVDSRVAEVLAILFKSESSADSVGDVREQVKKTLLESIAPNDDEIATRKLYESERDPQSMTWKSNGFPFVPESLAALYDWKVRHTPH